MNTVYKRTEKADATPMLDVTAPIVDEGWNILSRDWEVPRLSLSLKHVFALLPEVLRDNI